MSVAYNDPARGSTASDGSPTWEHAADVSNEAAVAHALEDRFDCTLHRYPRLHAVDFYAERHDRLVAHIEIKCRTHTADHFDTVFLNVRKYLSLHAAWLATGVPSLYVVGFTDTIRYVDVAHLGPRPARIAGASRIVKSSSDREPIIDIAITEMSPLTPAKEVAS